MIDLDRFSQGLPDQMDVLPVRNCDYCHEGIYPLESVYLFENGDVIHTDCFGKYAMEVLVCKLVEVEDVMY